MTNTPWSHLLVESTKFKLRGWGKGGDTERGDSDQQLQNFNYTRKIRSSHFISFYRMLTAINKNTFYISK
jgi:hypothetical protein